MVDATVAKQLVQAIIDNLPTPVPGRRPVHTIGVGVKGECVASDVARTYCIADHFNGRMTDGLSSAAWLCFPPSRTGREAT